MLLGPIVVLLGLGALWFWLRRQNRHSAADALGIIFAAISWVTVMLALFANTRLSRGQNYAVGAGTAIVCWFVFNRISGRGGAADE